MSVSTLGAAHPLPASRIAELAESGCFDEIANSPGSIRRYLLHHKWTHKGVTSAAIFFAIYQTGRYGPQNGFRMCLVHPGFDVVDGDYGGAEEPIAQDVMEWCVLGSKPPRIRDPDDEHWIEEDEGAVERDVQERGKVESEEFLSGLGLIKPS